MHTSKAKPQYSLHFVLGIAALTTALAASLTAAEEDENRRQRRGPPPEAIEACAELAEGSACAFTGRRGEASGVCFAPPREDAVLACAPEGGPRRRHDRDEESLEE
ncbi:MAG: hypothetical protein Cons2KO_25960 [Congregibacter sp.]